MANKIIQIHLVYTEGDINYAVAVQAEHTEFYHAFFGNSPSLSEYMIGRVIDKEVQLTKEQAEARFPNIGLTYQHK